MKFSFYQIFKFLMLVLMLLLDMVLIGINTYFYGKLNSSIHFGLSGVYSYGDLTSFSSYKQRCEVELPSTHLCDSLFNLQSAGIYLKTLLILDLVFLIFYAAISFIQHVYLRRIIRKKLMQQECSKRDNCVLSFTYKSRIALVLHPLLINLGFGIWIKLSNIESFSSEIVIESGIIIAIFQCFFSLLVIASYFWEVSTMRRRNMRLRKGSHKEETTEKSIEVQRYSNGMQKLQSFDNTHDEKSLAYSVRV